MFYKNVPDYMEKYIQIGGDAISVVIRALYLSSVTGAREFKNILDFPSGHGRVLRHLAAFFPEARLHACDINQDGVDFCVKTFGAEGIISNSDFDLEIDAPMDLIWCGSLLSHLPEQKCKQAIDFMIRNLSEKGIAIITLHGRFCSWIQKNKARYIPESAFAQVEHDYIHKGFGFTQAYGNNPDYGFCMSSPSNTLKMVESNSSIRIIGYQERGWAGHQDVLIIGKPPINQAF